MALHTIPKYQGYPTCNYKIGDCTLTYDGKLIIPECVERETATKLLEHLKIRGYVGEVLESEDRLTISIPREQLTDENVRILQQMVSSKKQLFMSAFAGNELEIVLTDTTVSFPWFLFTTETNEVNAYTTFVLKLCDMTRKQKRVMAATAETDNEKYAFRCYLLRLGFI